MATVFRTDAPSKHNSDGKGPDARAARKEMMKDYKSRFVSADERERRRRDGEPPPALPFPDSDDDESPSLGAARRGMVAANASRFVPAATREAAARGVKGTRQR